MSREALVFISQLAAKRHQWPIREDLFTPDSELGRTAIRERLSPDEQEELYREIVRYCGCLLTS